MDVINTTETLRWVYLAAANTTLTVHVLGEAALDTAVSLQTSQGTTIVTANSQPAGQPELISGQTIEANTQYTVAITTTNPISGGVSILLYEVDPLAATPFTAEFQGLLANGDTRANIPLNVNSDHYWHFSGSSGQQLTVTITPTLSGDPFLTLYSPDGSQLTAVDNNATGQPETLTYTLPASGFYAIRVADINLSSDTYTLSFSLP
ncbi:MAG: hypothetical protein Kow0080_14140 [Candidatus Promineifilaceae bacterium]